MSQRDLREKSAAKRPDETQKSLIENLAKARMDRVTGAGLSGLGASAMAFVAGGCLALGYFTGTWLDARAGTTYWMPIGVGVGLAASVREMFRTLKQLNAQTKREIEQRRLAKQEQLASQATSGEHRVLDSQKKIAIGETQVNMNVTEPETIRPRIFHVPPPPLSSFDAPEMNAEASRDNANMSPEDVENLDIDELTNKLLGKKDEDVNDEGRREQEQNGN